VETQLHNCSQNTFNKKNNDFYEKIQFLRHLKKVEEYLKVIFFITCCGYNFQYQFVLFSQMNHNNKQQKANKGHNFDQSTK